MGQGRARRQSQGGLSWPSGRDFRTLLITSAFYLAMAVGLLTGGSREVRISDVPPPPRQEPAHAGKVSRLLKEIYDEVVELGPNPGEAVLRGEFFVGEGDDDTYKDQHLVVLIQDVPGGKKMILQVTRLVPDPDRPRVKYGRDPRTVVCLVTPERLTVTRSDYPDSELVSALPDMLKAIRDRKKLIRGGREPGLPAVTSL